MMMMEMMTIYEWRMIEMMMVVRLGLLTIYERIMMEMKMVVRPSGAFWGF